VKRPIRSIQSIAPAFAIIATGALFWPVVWKYALAYPTTAATSVLAWCCLSYALVVFSRLANGIPEDSANTDDRACPRAVFEAADAAVSAPDPTAALGEMCRLAVREEAATFAGVCLLDRPTGALRLAASCPRGVTSDDSGSVLWEFSEIPQISACLHSGEVSVLPREAIPVEMSSLAGAKTKFFLLRPMRDAIGLHGVFVAGLTDELSADDSRRDLLGALMDLATCASATNTQKSTCAAGVEALRVLSGDLSCLGPHAALSDIRRSVVNTAGPALRGGAVALFMIDPFTGGTESEHTDTLPREVESAFIQEYSDLVVDPSLSGTRAIEVSACSEESRRVYDHYGIQSLVVATIRSEVGATGALVAFRPGGIWAMEGDRRLIEAIAIQATNAISYAFAIEQSRGFLDDLAGANQQLSLQATTDGLTGLANHRMLQQRLAELCKAGKKRTDRGFFLIMADVDNFKHYNDTYGHPEGDIVLRRVADRLAESIGEGDLAARYGGEEFAVIVRGKTYDECVTLAESARASIQFSDYPNGGVTVSMGIAGYPLDGETPGEIIECADRALYQAKADGRNRVVVWQHGEGYISEEAA